MRSFIPALFVLQLVYCSCPDGYELVKDGECRGFSAKIASTYEESRDVALSHCGEVQGKPVIIHTEEQQQYWLKKREAYTSSYLVLGLKCNGTTNKAEWVDGSPIDYIPKDGGIDDMNYCYTDCSWYLWNDGHYHSLCTKIDVKVLDIFCTTQLQQPVPTGDSCSSIDEDDKDAGCYQVSKIAENWEDAQKICKTLGADLASVHSQQENNFIRRLAVTNGAVQGVSLGGRSGGNGGQWADGSTWDYDNFAAGQPVAGQGECLTMDTSTSAGQWKNTDCSAAMPVACKRQPSNAVCSSGPWTEGQFITSPGYPFNASTPCEYQFSVAAGKRVEVEVIILEANSCCDQLVLYDAFTGGNIVANVTGEVNNKVYKTKSSSKMRVSWQPSGGVNVKGMMITYRAV